MGTAPVPTRLLGEPLVLWRPAAGAPAAALIDRCPHRWAALSEGEVLADGTIRCPYHGWTFGADGRARTIPSLAPEAPLPPRACVDALAVTERYGVVWAGLVAEPVSGLPLLPEWEDPTWRIIPIGTFRYECAAPVVIENNLDPTHVAFVHRASFGAGQDPMLDPPEVEATTFGLRQSSRFPVTGRPGDDSLTVRTSTTEIWAPFVQISRMRYPDGLGHVLFKVVQPLDDHRCDVLLTVLRTDGEAAAPAADIVAFEGVVEREDAAVLAGVPGFPLDPTAQVHLRHDRGGLELRRVYRRMIDAAAP